FPCTPSTVFKISPTPLAQAGQHKCTPLSSTLVSARTALVSANKAQRQDSNIARARCMRFSLENGWWDDSRRWKHRSSDGGISNSCNDYGRKLASQGRGKEPGVLFRPP